MMSQYEKYLERFGVRFYRGEKKKFINEVKQDLATYNMKELVLHSKKWLRKSESYVFGNLKTAKVILNVPYDTQSKMFWMNSVYYPLDGETTQKKQVLPLTLQIIAVYFLCVFALLVLTAFVGSAASMVVANLSLFVILGIVLKVAYSGFKNKKNYNRNTSGVIVALEVLKALDPSVRGQVAIAFTDSNLASYIGVKSVAEELKAIHRNPVVLTLNTVGIGEELRIGYNEGSRKEASALLKKIDLKNVSLQKLSEDQLYLTPAMPFIRSVSIAAGNVDKKGNLYAVHANTGKDRQLDEVLMEKEVVMITSYIEGFLKQK